VQSAGIRQAFAAATASGSSLGCSWSVLRQAQDEVMGGATRCVHTVEAQMGNSGYHRSHGRRNDRSQSPELARRQFVPSDRVLATRRRRARSEGMRRFRAFPSRRKGISFDYRTVSSSDLTPVAARTEAVAGAPPATAIFFCERQFRRSASSRSARGRTAGVERGRVAWLQPHSALLAGCARW